MKLVAKGYYYRVYDTEDGRVVKKLQPLWYSWMQVFRVVRKNERLSLFHSLRAARGHVAREYGVLREMKERISRMPAWIFAEAEFVGDSLDYRQAKVISIEEYLKTHSLGENQKIVDLYLELQRTLWSFGLHDDVYKFQPNYGVDTEGRVVCLDIGEFVFTKEAALASIAKRKWLARPSYHKWPDDELKRYYTERMEETMTGETVSSCWRS